MLFAILVLMGCQLVGEGLRDALNLPVPGPVIGMFLLTLALACRKKRQGIVPPALEATADSLISSMGLLFVPAGVGIIAEAPLLGQQWMPIIVAVIGSTILSLGVTGFVMHKATRWSEKRQARELGPIVKKTFPC